MPSYQNKGEYLSVRVSEPYSLKLFISIVHEVAEHCEKENLNKALIDLMQVQGNPSMLDRYEVGVEIADVWGRRIKAAAAGRPAAVNYLAEDVAVNRGANLRVFLNAEAALEWLMAR